MAIDELGKNLKNDTTCPFSLARLIQVCPAAWCNGPGVSEHKKRR